MATEERLRRIKPFMVEYMLMETADRIPLEDIEIEHRLKGMWLYD